MNLQYPLDLQFHAYKDIEIIKCKQAKIIVIGWNVNQEEYGAIVFDKIKTCDYGMRLSDIFVQIQQKPTYEQIKQQIQKLTGSFHPKETISGFGIVGFHKFLQGYYLTYVSQVEPVAKIGKHRIYTIKNTSILPLFENQSDRKTRKNQEKYLQILDQFKLENFYFSPTYDLSHSMAINMIRNSKKIFQFPSTEEGSMSNDSNKQKSLSCSDIFAFNYDLISEFHNSLQNKKFVIPMVHGYCKHINVNLKSTIFNIVVIARRSRHHAGTRYIKRGISSDGFVANFVEIEQIVINYSSSQDSRPVCSSFIQVRGSVPTYWMQRPSIHIPKPAIQIKSDDYMFLATRKHFKNLMSRYGSLVYSINLMKMKQKVPRESLLSKEYQTAVSFINREDLKQQSQIHYVEIDMKYNLRLDKKLFVNKMKTIAYFAIQNTGLFMCMNPSTSSHQQFIEFQNGIIRANCVDCLDRTNSFQQLVGQTALAIQLNRLIKQAINFESLQLPDKILDEYSKLYQEMGDLISIQYGSSLAHKQKIQKSTESRFEFLIAITRHVNNNWNDYDRQRQMDVFLGCKPDPNGPQIWEEKPTISHYPSRDLQSLQNQNWAEEALKQFSKSHYLQDFRKINSKQDYERNLMNMQRFFKEDLVSKFNIEIVSSLVSQTESISLLQFFVLPRTNYTKIFWPLESKNVKKTQSLKEELQFCYNKLDFIKNSEAKTTLSSQKQIRNGLLSEGYNLTSGKKVKPSPSFHFEQKGGSSTMIMKNVDRYTDSDIYLDEAESKIIERYMLGQLIEDNQIEDELENYNLFLSGQVEVDWPSAQQIQRQLRLLASNMSNKSYINFSQVNDTVDLIKKKKKTFVQIQSIKTMKSEGKNEKIKENKILILEQIMRRNFSHGNIEKIQQI